MYKREHRSIQVARTGLYDRLNISCVHACIQYIHKHRLNIRAHYYPPIGSMIQVFAFFYF